MSKSWKAFIVAVAFVALSPAAFADVVPGLAGRVFFLSTRGGGYGVWVTELDSGATRQVIDLSQRFALVGGLTVSPDGKRLAFLGVEGPSYAWELVEVYVLNSDGSELRAITAWDGRSAEVGPRWSPTEPDILYYMHDRNWDGYIRRFDLRSGEDTPIPRLVPGSFNGQFDITGDGLGAVIVQEESCCLGQQRKGVTIYQALDGSSWHYLRLGNDLSDQYLRVNPGDGWIVYTEELTGGHNDFGLWLMDPSAGSIQLLAWPLVPGQLSNAEWAGQRHDDFILFTSRHTGDSEIFAMRAVPGQWPGGAINLTNSLAEDWSPSWTPVPGTRPDTTPPTFTAAPPTQVLEATSGAGANAFWAPVTATDDRDPDPDISCSFNSGSAFPIATTTVTCVATDDAGNAASVSFSITVRDTTPPVLGDLKATPSVLWPPNHQLVSVETIAQAVDIVDPAPICRVIRATSSEPINGLGDGDVAPDWMLGNGLSVDLRAERSGKGFGRTYTMTVTCTDRFGNSSSGTATVSVPKNAGK